MNKKKMEGLKKMKDIEEIIGKGLKIVGRKEGLQKIVMEGQPPVRGLWNHLTFYSKLLGRLDFCLFFVEKTSFGKAFWFKSWPSCSSDVTTSCYGDLYMSSIVGIWMTEDKSMMRIEIDHCAGLSTTDPYFVVDFYEVLSFEGIPWDSPVKQETVDDFVFLHFGSEFFFSVLVKRVKEDLKEAQKQAQKQAQKESEGGLGGS